MENNTRNAYIQLHDKIITKSELIDIIQRYDRIAIKKKECNSLKDKDKVKITPCIKIQFNSFSSFAEKCFQLRATNPLFNAIYEGKRNAIIKQKYLEEFIKLGEESKLDFGIPKDILKQLNSLK